MPWIAFLPDSLICELTENLSFMEIKHHHTFLLFPALACFFSPGFKIWKEHIKDSSTLIMAPSRKSSPEKKAYYPHYRIPRSNSEPKRR